MSAFDENGCITFHTYGQTEEIRYIELINAIGSLIDNGTVLTGEASNRVRKYGVKRFKDITKVTW